MSFSPQFFLSGHVFGSPILSSGLYIISTPIGNLSDITIRALEVLSSCSLLACEDTRTSKVLLKHYGITTRCVSYTEHNSDRRISELLDRLKSGESVGLVSDAGTPLISDPGFRLVQSVHSLGFPIIPIGGLSSPIVALVGSGLSPSSFRFLGFLPTKSGAIESQFAQLSDSPDTLIFFTTKHRILSTLRIAGEVFGSDRLACVARELTKLHETFHRGTLSELCIEFESIDSLKGELVLLISGTSKKVIDDSALDSQISQVLQSMKPGDAAQHLSVQTGLSRQAIYNRILELKRCSDEG